MLTSSGEIKAMLLIGSIVIVGAIGFRMIFTHPAQDAENSGGAPGKKPEPPAEKEQPKDE